MYRTPGDPSTGEVTVRLASDADVGALATLAILDSAEAPARPALIAEIDGKAVAALSVKGDSAVADPFRRTAALLALLELRAAQLRGESRAGGGLRSLAGRVLRAPRAMSVR